MTRICFVCLGNICRSPTAEGIMHHLVNEKGWSDRIHIDSAGTGNWHVGKPADERARATAQGHGIELLSRARQFQPSDFDNFDYLVVMDQRNRSNVLDMAPDDAAKAKVRMMRSFDAQSPADADVPDPYHAGEEGFEQVFQICKSACEGLLKHIEEHHSAI